MERSLTLAQRAFSLGAAAIAVVGVASVVHFGVSVRSHVRWAPKDDAAAADAADGGGPTGNAPIFRMPAGADAPATATAAAAAAAATATDETGGGGGGALAPGLPPTAAVSPGDVARDAASNSSKP